MSIEHPCDFSAKQTLVTLPIGQSSHFDSQTQGKLTLYSFSQDMELIGMDLPLLAINYIAGKQYTSEAIE